MCNIIFLNNKTCSSLNVSVNFVIVDITHLFITLKKIALSKFVCSEVNTFNVSYFYLYRDFHNGFCFKASFFTKKNAVFL